MRFALSHRMGDWRGEFRQGGVVSARIARILALCCGCATVYYRAVGGLMRGEICYLPAFRTGAMLFFQFMNRFHEHVATGLPRTKCVEEWGSILGDDVVPRLDRLATPYLHAVNLRGNRRRMGEYTDLWQTWMSPSQLRSH